MCSKSVQRIEEMKMIKQPTGGYELIYVIVNFGMGSRILHKARKCGIPTGTIFLGKGTVNNSLLNFFSLYDERKEIVMLGAQCNVAQKTLEQLNEEFEFSKPNHGIAFSVGVDRILGSRTLTDNPVMAEGEQSMYQIISTIVARGTAEDVIDAATAAGAKGGTIINARGSGVNETTRVFNIEVEPEKELVIVIVKNDIADAVIGSIQKAIGIDKPGHGIMFVQSVNRVYGIYE